MIVQKQKDLKKKKSEIAWWKVDYKKQLILKPFIVGLECEFCKSKENWVWFNSDAVHIFTLNLRFNDGAKYNIILVLFTRKYESECNHSGEGEADSIEKMN